MGDIGNLNDLLPIYYARLFPFNDYYDWLSYGSSKFLQLNILFLKLECNKEYLNFYILFVLILANNFTRREFSFTLQDDIYLRFQSFRTLKDLEADIKRLLPFKIDIGAVYNVP